MSELAHVVMFSGGIGSWCAAKRVREANPDADVVALFADTKMEDEDLYRFVQQGAKALSLRLVTVSDGRTPWEVFRDERFLGNSRVDPCSRILKREITHGWLFGNYDPREVLVYVGIDWSESHRYERIRDRWASAGWTYLAPMCNPPYLTKHQMLDEAKAMGVDAPRLYSMGFSHNNCGGFCVKAGQAHFENLLRQMPERYRWHEAQEEEIRAELGDVAIMRDRTGGVSRPLTMREFRERLEGQRSFDPLDWGGCGCFAGEGA